MTTRIPHPLDTGIDRLHDVDSAAEYLRCGRRLIYRLVAERKIKFTKVGRSLRFWQSDLDGYLEACAVEPLDPVRTRSGSGVSRLGGGRPRSPLAEPRQEARPTRSGLSDGAATMATGDPTRPFDRI